MPEFNLDESWEEYFKSMECNQLITEWREQVRSIYKNKGIAPKLY